MSWILGPGADSAIGDCYMLNMLEQECLPMRSFRHWTPRYVYDRVALMRYESQFPDSPWLTPEIVAILETWLRPEDTGLEWGSGRSTLWFARRVKGLISVEHDEEWADTVRGLLRDADLESRVDYRCVPSESSRMASIDYVDVAKNVTAGSLDFCLVDGLERDRCVLACLHTLKPGGIVIIDNVNWYLPRSLKSRAPNSRSLQDGCASERWHEFMERTKEWRSIWTSSGVTDTAFWVKPI